jgi:hypothetical protein
VRRRRFLCEKTEGGLKSVLGIVAGQQAATNAEHHRAMTPHQEGEGVFVAVGREALQELTIGSLRRRSSAGQLTEMPQQECERVIGHE